MEVMVQVVRRCSGALWFRVWGLGFGVWGLGFGVCGFVVCNLQVEMIKRAKLHQLHVTLHTSHVTLHTSHVTLHTSHFTLHTSGIISGCEAAAKGRDGWQGQVMRDV
jgi:hypothetical protein